MLQTGLPRRHLQARRLHPARARSFPKPAEETAEPPEDPQHKSRFEEALKELGKRVEERDKEDE